MKKTDFILLISTLLFSALYYQQSAGINYFLITLLVSAALLLINPDKIKDRTWWYYSTSAVLASAAVLFVNSDLSVFACITSTAVLSSRTINPKNSTLVCWLFGCYSLISAFFHLIIAVSIPSNEGSKGEKQSRWKLFGSILIISSGVLLFFYLYKLSNPLFNDFTKFINLDWLSFGWIFFTIFGFILLYGLLRSKKIEAIAQADITASADIENNNISIDSKKDNALIGIVLFAILNMMLLLLNGLDIVNIYISQKLPTGITLSDFVHQAVWSTVFSILIAVSLISFLFKAESNFSPIGQKMKILVYLWIIQSIVVVINTMIRNYWYILEYQLTYLRIGVFVFLILCLIGLVLTFYKVARRKSTWKLAITNFEIWYALLILASLVNWDRVITRYNIEHSSAVKVLDKSYLFRLSDANIPDLVNLYATTSFSNDEKRWFYYKILDSYKKDRFRQWQSFNFRMKQNAIAINNLQLK